MDTGLIVHCLVTRKKGTELLILKRSFNESYLPGVWDVPGGTLEWGEDPFEGVARETKEEAGLSISSTRLIDYYSNVDSGKQKHFVTLIFVAEHEGDQEPTLSEDHDEFAWITKEEAKDYDLIHYLPSFIDQL